MERKEVDTQQFIDHTLLATELMQNNFMMDLMDHTGVFPKTEGPTNLSTTTHHSTTNGGGYVEKHTLTSPELNFHNTIFQFVNKHVVEEPNGARTDAVPTSPERTTNNYVKDTDVEFLTLNSSFLDRADAAAAATAGGNENVVAQQVPQPTFPALAIEPTVPIDVNAALHGDDLLYAHNASVTNARKVLPHKKRISRKLKGSVCGLMEGELEQHKHQHVVSTVANYSCEICGYAVNTQIEFYAHLKEHYDPGSLQQRLDVPQQQQQQQVQQQQVQQQQVQQQQQQQQKEPLDMCGLSAQDKQEQAKLDQVFQDVQLNFENFHNISHVDDDVVDDVGVNMVIHADAMSLHKADGKLTPVGAANATATNAVAVVDDVEFSDTEDMLEGIRNVVDKVSVEDTCDAPWFNNNFSDIAFSGLLLPGEPPPVPPPAAPTPPAATLLKSSNHMDDHPQDEQLTLNFLKQSTQPKLEMGHKKSYIEAIAAAEAAAAATAAMTNSTATSMSPPARTPTPNDGSTIEQLQRSPLMLSESFKLEDVETAAPTVSANSSPAAADVIDDNADSYLMEPDKPPVDEPSDTKRKFHCDICARDFNSYNALKYHQYTHTKERAYPCNTCERSFYTQSALKAHERTHSGIKPYKCEKCDFKFRQWGDLNYHIISRHTEVKAHMCEYCGKSFSRKYSLVLHRRIHTSERNYACQYCTKTFRASSYLLAHTKVHTGEKPYSCSVCDKKFRVSGDLKRHTRIHDPARLGQTTSESATKKRNNKLKQIEDEDVEAIIKNKSEALCGDAEQEILGL
ncbi:zinc finger protein 384 isoform X2 [Drosophila navojoa]|uniref:zinc finger protein 384 isoform X2 n=1 Tax=Drosophila navojoa TaxID=7232 RepID=UPI0011BFB0E1|nr:zinc finger protein 384 isoform X2 [Drosophila navojoa]